MATPAKICIYFSDTGGGHRDAAEAVKAGIEQLVESSCVLPEVHVTAQPILENSHPVNRWLVRAYNYLARHHTTWIKYLYSLIHAARPESSQYYGFYRSYLNNLLRVENPSVIVAVHPMIVEALIKGRDEIGSTAKVVVVVTDPNEALWRAWACPQADLIIVPNNQVCDKLIEWGVDAGKIQVLGMPIHPAFVAKARVSRRDFLKQLGLSPDVFTVCINSGWAGNAHLLESYAELMHCEREVQAIFLCGHNKELYGRAHEMARQIGINTAVLPFHSQMPELMNAADVMITKAGGLTTYQALARRLPLVLDNTIEPMPQEAPTMEMLIECGLAKSLNRPSELPGIIGELQSRVRPNQIVDSKYQLDLTDSAIFSIAESILSLNEDHLHSFQYLSA